MDRDELREAQRPLKERYQAEPGSALITLHAEGSLADAPVGFRSIRLTFELTSDATPEELEKLIATTERYCVVFQTPARTPELSVTTTPAASREAH